MAYYLLREKTRRYLQMEKEYMTLFNAITDAINQLERVRRALQAAQIRAEEIFIIKEEKEPSVTAAP